jgi:hypothetical protein
MELLPKAGMFGAFELLALQRIVIFLPALPIVLNYESHYSRAFGHFRTHRSL